MLLRHLAQAERHVAEGAAHIERQRQLVARLAYRGASVEEVERAQQLLLDLEEMQGAHCADCERIKGHLAEP